MINFIHKIYNYEKYKKLMLITKYKYNHIKIDILNGLLILIHRYLYKF